MREKSDSFWAVMKRMISSRRNDDASLRGTTQRGRTLSRRRIAFWICVFLLTTGIGVYLRAEIHQRIARNSPTTSTAIVQKGGTLFVVGGGQMNSLMRERFIELAGARSARIVVIPAMAIEKSEFEQYREPWNTYHVQSVDVLHAESRTEADDPEFSRILETATGVWLAGGQQSWLSAWYGRTRVETRLKELLARDGVIGGTSAGAAVMSGVMIAGGQHKPVFGHGLDLIPGAIIDQHFLKRNRLQRMLTALEQHPELIGFGIDESTALQYGVESGRFRVIGQSTVIACVPHADANSPPTFRFEVLNPGDEFDIERLRSGEPLPPHSIDLDTILWGE